MSHNYINKVNRFFRNVRNVIRWIPTLYKDREWDYSFMLEIEQKKLKNMIKWYEQNDYGNSTSGPLTVKQMKLAVRLLDIILEKENFWSIDYPEGYEFVVDHKYKPLPETSFVIDKYINTKNYKRFFSWLNDNAMKSPSWKIDLRIRKAWYIYHKLLEQYMMDWWD